MKLFVGNSAKNALGKVSQIWKSWSGVVLPSGQVAALTLAEVNDGVSNALFTKILGAVAVTHPGTDTFDVAGNTNTNGREFTLAQGVRKLIITATPVIAFSTTTDTAVEATNEYVDVVVDSGNGALAKSIFEEALTDVVDATHAYGRIPFNQRIELPISEAIITRIDFRPTSIAKILVEGY